MSDATCEVHTIQIDAVQRQLSDHELRIRSLEHYAWRLMGLVSVAAFLATFLAAIAARHI